jgi:acetyltransferase
VHAALDAGGVPNFYTPETSVDALSFLMEYRHNQSLLLEAPSPSPEPQRLEVGHVEALRVLLADSGRSELGTDEGERILAAFGLIGNGTTRRAERASRNAQGLVAGIATDRRFGPVVFVRPASVQSLAHRRAVMLPPLNERLAADLLAQACDDLFAQLERSVVDALVVSLTRLSALACALPWVQTLTLELEVTNGQRVAVGAATFDIEPQRKLMRGYPHVAIHPYPAELIGDVTLRDGTILHVRPIRPEDGTLERAFVEALSEQTRYYRFFHRLSELTPAMLARFTQVDYDRELALVALTGAGTDAAAFVGVARYIANPDRTSAEFAVVVGDAWQRRGVATVLMRGLIVCAKRRGFDRLVGMVLRENERMIGFVRALGFAVAADPEDPAQVCATLRLQEA